MTEIPQKYQEALTWLKKHPETLRSIGWIPKYELDALKYTIKEQKSLIREAEGSIDFLAKTQLDI